MGGPWSCLKDVPDFVDSVWESLPSVRSRWGGVERNMGVAGEGEGEKTGNGM